MPSTSGLDSTHPEYDCRVQQWIRCKDVLAGQDKVKSRDSGLCYLPPSGGMLIDGMKEGQLGLEKYKAYLKRAHFYGYYNEAVDLAMGMLWNKPPVIEGIKDTPLSYLLERATHEGESLERLLYRINEAQVGTGRIGILADLPAGETSSFTPYISIYCETSITNWDAGYTGQLATEKINMLVLDESGPRREEENPFEWEEYSQYRVLSLGNFATNESKGIYYQGVYELEGGGPPEFDISRMKAPSINDRKLDEIPFVCINANSTTMCPQDPPLLSLADLVLHLYRLQADYSQELHGQTSATLVTRGLIRPKGKENEPIRIGVGGHVDLGSSDTAEAYYLELSGKGLPELKAAVESAKQLCRERSGEIVDQSSRGRESGNSLEQRISVRTASLNSIAQHGAEGLTKLLKIIGKWVGMDQSDIDKIRITPNTVFAKPTFSGIELEALTKSKINGGAIIPYRAIHNYLVQRGFTTQSFEEFKSQWEEEKPLVTEMQKILAEGELMKKPPEPMPAQPSPKPVSNTGNT